MQSTMGRALCGLLLVALSLARPTEQERVKLWYEAGNRWPPTWQEETDGMKRLMEHREKEIMAIPGADERWENWMQYTQSRLVPKFTARGFDKVRMPDSTFRKLKKALDEAVNNWNNVHSEGSIDVIYNPPGLDPKFARIGSLQREVHEELKELHEAWGGMKLVPTSAYGIRLYQNGSTLVMHHDKVHTHVISSIVHIGHEYDDPANPWPIEIEDHWGNLHAVNLEPGDMLFYESAKCLHGRMRTFRGSYYGSIFLHYQPMDKGIWSFDVEKIIASVPPHWRKGVHDEEKGSRWAGAALTTDSRVAEGAPPRTLEGKLLQETLPHNFPAFQPPPGGLDPTSPVPEYAALEEEGGEKEEEGDVHSEL
jgi:hypothetical protein